MGSTYCVFLPSILSYNAQLALVQSHRLQAGVLQTYVHRHCGLVLRKNRMLTERSQGSGCSGKQVSWGGGCCPYILAMDNLAIKALPHIVNALAVFSAGNSYPYCASHTLCGFALSGIAPPFLRYGVSQMQGIPIYCVLVSLSCRFLSLLQSGDHSQVVLSWIVNLVASCQLLNYHHVHHMCRILLCLQEQKHEQIGPPLYRMVPAIPTAAFVLAMVFIGAYPVRETVLELRDVSFLLMFLELGLFVGYKLVYRTQWKKSSMVDWEVELQEVEAYEAELLGFIATKRKLRSCFQKIVNPL